MEDCAGRKRSGRAPAGCLGRRKEPVDRGGVGGAQAHGDGPFDGDIGIAYWPGRGADVVCRTPPGLLDVAGRDSMRTAISSRAGFGRIGCHCLQPPWPDLRCRRCALSLWYWQSWPWHQSGAAFPGEQTLAAAMIAVLFIDPSAPSAAGFWLSFYAVTLLLLSGIELRGFELGCKSPIAIAASHRESKANVSRPMGV